MVQASRAADEIRSLSGIASATSDVVARDGKDHPGDWVVTIVAHARAADRLGTTPGPVLDAMRRSEFGRAYRVTVILDVPGTVGFAPVRISGLGEEQAFVPAGPGVVDAADRLRRLPLAKRIDFESGTGTVTLTESAAHRPSPLAEAIVALRSVAGLGSGALTVIDVLWPEDQHAARSIEVAPSAPSDTVVALLDEAASQHDVTRIDARENRPDVNGTSPDANPQGSRPTLAIESARPEILARALAAAADPAAERGERPRTAFDVFDEDRSNSVQGFVGSLRGSAAAGPTWDDLLAPAPDLVARAESLKEYEDAVRSFLQRATSLSPAPGDARPDIRRGPCVTGDGEAVRGSVLLRLWHDPNATDESVGDAFASITADWARAGLAPRDRALGTDFWAPDDIRAGPPGIAQASIRGTTEGLRIEAVSQCPA